MKANDLGKLGGVKRSRRSSGSRVTLDKIGHLGGGRTTGEPKEVEDDDEPWLRRINKKAKAAKIITLSDEE